MSYSASDAQSHDPDPQLRELFLFGRGDLVTVAIEAQAPETQRSEKPHNGTPPRVVNPPRSFGEFEFTGRRCQRAQRSSLGGKCVEDLDSGSTEFGDAAQVSGVGVVEDFCAHCRRLDRCLRPVFCHVFLHHCFLLPFPVSAATSRPVFGYPSASRAYLLPGWRVCVVLGGSWQ